MNRLEICMDHISNEIKMDMKQVSLTRAQLDFPTGLDREAWDIWLGPT